MHGKVVLMEEVVAYEKGYWVGWCGISPKSRFLFQISYYVAIRYSCGQEPLPCNNFLP